MNKLRRICAIVLFSCSFLFFNAQVKTDTLRFYYGINESDPQVHFARMDSAVKSLNGKIIKLKVIGYADFLHTSDYNQTLSVKRAEGIKNYLLKIIPSAQINTVNPKGMGETASSDNGSKEGQASMRRVDLFIEPFVIMQQEEIPKTDTMHLDLHFWIGTKCFK